MKYCDYDTEQIMSNNQYKNMCNLFIELANDDETKEKLESILYNGGYKDFSISSDIVSNDNPYIEEERRISMAYLIIRNPETFDALVEDKINIFHGTNARALPNILKHGICSVDEIQNNNVEVTTGEKSTYMQSGRSFVSFTDVLDISEKYSTLYNDDSELSFPIIFGTTIDDIYNAGKVSIYSEFPEVGVKKTLSKESIRIIMVPSEKVDLVSSFVGDSIAVFAADDIEDRFYYIDDLGIHIDENIYNDLLYSMEKTKTGIIK